VVEVEASYQLNPSQEPVIHMGFVSVSSREWVSSASASNLPITHILPPISLIALERLSCKGQGIDEEKGRRRRGRSGRRSKINMKKQVEEEGKERGEEEMKENEVKRGKIMAKNREE
jgi:hypothetical protein